MRYSMFFAVAHADTLLVPLFARSGHEIERACISVWAGLPDGQRSLRYVTVADLRLLRIEFPRAGKISTHHRPRDQQDWQYLPNEWKHKASPYGSISVAEVPWMEWQYSATATEAHESCISPRQARMARATHLPKPRS